MDNRAGIVFILLIFFVVTTSFVSETVLDIQRPQSSSSETLPRENIPVAVGADGRITVEGTTHGDTADATATLSKVLLTYEFAEGDPNTGVIVGGSTKASAEESNDT